jgi:NodT family efflux transporter outer membrane factor (OMF) lipoprotein
MRISGVAVLMLLAGCAVGPDFKRPAPPADTSYTPDPLPVATAAARTTAGASQRFVSDINLPGEWWKLFHSQPLNALVEQALKCNPNITAARAALRQAHETVLAQQGVYYPQLAAGLSASRNLTPIGSVSPASASGNPYYSLITPQLSVSFVPDIFGANRRTVESLAAQAENQEFQLEATYLTLTSNVVAAAVQEASLRGQIAAAGETIRIEGDLLGILHKQMALGQVAGADVAAQEAALAQAQQALPPLQKQLAQQRDQIAVLAGLGPGAAMPERFELGSLDLPVDLPVSLPSKLIEQRPDIRAADATLLHKQRAAEAAFDQAAASYRATVLTGMQNVADTLHALVSDADGLQAAVAAEVAARRSLEITRQQLKLGQIAYLALLNAEQTYQQARLSLVQAEANRLADTAALFESAGGGWWDRTDVAEVDNKATRQ